MKQSSLAIFIFLFLSGATYAHSPAHARQLNFADGRSLETRDAVTDLALAARSIQALQRLNQDVLVYRSLGDFEANGKLARVSLQVFQNDLREVSAEVEPLLSRLSQGKLRSQLQNSLASYQDGAFWWQKIDRPRVIHVSALGGSEFNRAPTETAFLSSVPYTVAIHWRQAGEYLKRAQASMSNTNK